MVFQQITAFVLRKNTNISISIVIEYRDINYKSVKFCLHPQCVFKVFNGQRFQETTRYKSHLGHKLGVFLNFVSDVI